MKHFIIFSSRSWFSVLVALGTTGFLLILAIWLANIFISEMKINRMVYDGIMAYTAGEWAFEYAKLKIKNHRDGFSDALTPKDIDANLLDGSLPRSKGVLMTYEMTAQSKDSTFSLAPGEYLILPLFVGDDALLVPGWSSKRPTTSDHITSVTEINVDGIDERHSWTLLGTASQNQSIWLTGKGNINFGSSKWTIRNKSIQCYDKDARLKPPYIPLTVYGRCPPPYDSTSGGEELEYFYDTENSVREFMSSGAISERFITVFNDSDRVSTITVTTDAPFSLPTSELVTNGKIGKTSQTFRFTEDKSKYYDALKYGLYEAD